MIEVVDLKKSYTSRKKSVAALKGISFTARPGRIFGLIGPNGAGKTTTLRTIATLLKPDSGTVTVAGHDTVRDARKVRDSIGFLTSDMKLSGNLSPRELLVFFGRLNHLEETKIDERATWLADYLGMGEFLDRPVSKLSTGMKQKASIAVSLVHDPGVIVFDEPTAGLDILAAKVVTDFLDDATKHGKTVVLSTHVIPDAERLCNDVGILVDGRLLACGTREELLERNRVESLESLFFALYHGNGGSN